MPDQPRPVWLTREQRDAIQRGRFGDATAATTPKMDDAMAHVVAAWDAAPADPTEAAAAKLNEIDLDPAFRDQPWYVVAPHVLRALGMPDAQGW